MASAPNLDLVVSQEAALRKQVLEPSTSTQEIELKFLMNEATFQTMQQSARLVSLDERMTIQRLHSTYFDTEHGDLRRHRMVLRMRRQRGRHVLTMKWDGASGGSPFARGEVEALAASSIPDPGLLGAAAEAEIKRVTQGRPLTPSFATDIKRVARRVFVGRSEIEAAFDTGFIVFGEQKTPVREVELELKAGDPIDLYQLGLALIAEFPLRLGIMSKAERGLLMSAGVHASAVRADVPPLADQTIDQAIGAIIGACVKQFVSNWPAFEGPDKAEAVHQMRVAMRRLRSALGLFQRAFPCSDFVVLRAEAKRIASAMGEARNWDVFEDLVRAGPLQAFPDEPGFEALMDDLARLRDESRAEVAAVLAQPETTHFVLSAEAFVARRGWRNALSGDDLPRLTESASSFAAESLQRLHRRVRKRAKALLELAPEERHNVRIALKKVRYAADFFGDLFEHTSGVRTYAQAASKLQDALGNYNDMVMATELVQRLDTKSPAAAKAAGIIMGWFGREARTNDTSLREVWRSFRRVKPFWDHDLPEPPKPTVR